MVLHVLQRLAFALSISITLALTTTVAAAEQLEVSTTSFSIKWNNSAPATKLTFEGAASTDCIVTLSGSFHRRTMSKTAGTLVGVITQASVSACTPDDMTVLAASLPWHVTYESFGGTLPSIERVRLSLIGVALLIQFDAIGECLMQSDLSEPFSGETLVDISTGVADGFTMDADPVIDVVDLEGSFFCDLGGGIRFVGSASLENGSGGSVVVRLTGDPVANLAPSPSSVTVERLEESDRFTITNTGTGTATAVLDRVSLTGVDTERPEFEASSPGCGMRIVDAASCVYTIRVNERPLAGAGVTIEYDDDGGAGTTRRVSIPVEIEGEDREASLVASSDDVTVEALEQNAILAIRNDGGGLSATVDRVEVRTTDLGSPEFEVTSPGCSGTLADNETCNYVIRVNARPEPSGEIVIEYDDGRGTTRRVTITVDIAELPRPALLRAIPTSVTIERLEANDSFVIRNEGEGATAAEITRIEAVTSDSERPDFAVSGPGCSLLVIDETSCTYIITVNSRPEASGRVVFYYRDGIGGERTTTVEVDIAS